MTDRITLLAGLAVLIATAAVLWVWLARAQPPAGVLHAARGPGGGAGDARNQNSAMRLVVPALLFALALVLPAAAADGEKPLALAMNLAPVRDWSTQQPFIDVMKTARRWVGHLPGQWGGVSFEQIEARGILDANGWPTAIPPDLGSIGTLVLTDLPEGAAAYAGRYVLRFDGEGIVEVSGAVRNLRYGRGEVRFDFTPGGAGSMVDVRIQRSDPRNTGAYVRDISIIREDHDSAWRAGALFNPLWLETLRGVKALRFMDWMVTNESSQSRWQDRPRVADFSYTRRGVPAEVMIALANELGAAPWFNMPHQSDAEYQRRFARLVADTLDPALEVCVEFSNEVWNWQFPQAEWAEAAARARWGRAHKGQEWYGMKSAQMAQIWSGVFTGQRARLVSVIATQTGWPGLEKAILEAPLWVAEDPVANAPPYTYADAYAVTGYFGGFLGRDENRARIHGWLAESRAAAEAAAEAAGLADAARAKFIAARRHDLAIRRAAELLGQPAQGEGKDDTLPYVLGTMLPYHAGIASRYGLDLIVYEGGSHVVGLGALIDEREITDFFIDLNYSPAMGALYQRLLSGWARIGGDGLFALYHDVSAPTKWGSWGHLRHLGDVNPRWRAVERYRGARP